MQKKILIFTLCFTIIFSSLNIKKSYANPLLGKVAEVSIIYSIGRLAFDTAGFVGTIADIIDLGGSIYSKMSDSAKDNYKNSVNFEDDKFTYNDDSYNYISNYVPSKKSFHLMPGVYRTFIPKAYNSNSKPGSDIAAIYDANKQFVNIQGTDYEFMVYAHNIGTDYVDYYLYYNFAGSFSPTNYFKHRINKGLDYYYRFYISSINEGKGTLKFDFVYITNSINATSGTLFNNILSNCNNCPHDISLKPTYKYPTSSELEEIEKNYPQYENDIVVPGDVSTGGGSNGGGSNGGGSNGGGSNGNNSPIITNPPSFPNLEEFDFSGLQLEPLTNLFSNFKNKFPFSLPFDLANLIDGLTQDPIPPVFEADLFGETMRLDLTQFTDLANILKAFTILCYLVSLILITKKFGG